MRTLFCADPLNRNQVDLDYEQEADSLGQQGLSYSLIDFEALTQRRDAEREYRLFVLDGKPMALVPYWEEGTYGGDAPNINDFSDAIGAVRSRFFTMDLAKQRGGGWVIVELGEAQVAGLPEQTDVKDFYHKLQANLAVG